MPEKDMSLRFFLLYRLLCSWRDFFSLRLISSLHGSSGKIPPPLGASKIQPTLAPIFFLSPAVFLGNRVSFFLPLRPCSVPAHADSLRRELQLGFPLPWLPSSSPEFHARCLDLPPCSSLSLPSSLAPGLPLPARLFPGRSHLVPGPVGRLSFSQCRASCFPFQPTEAPAPARRVRLPRRLTICSPAFLPVLPSASLLAARPCLISLRTVVSSASRLRPLLGFSPMAGTFFLAAAQISGAASSPKLAMAISTAGS
ncbi:uncharacterized protein [Zea mays]|uniref:uncharacterized protein n=1 Tax=Zea mays TaxID=4577 RepID=UPI0009A9AD94|nr:uncharacterized protein LOC109941982 [Zea mays]XP_035817624.1 uncharacterized protein LOC109941982 [Zea mays]|eukprot:XP_020398873.1 uncharacterized protein LOC109941981 [Zea mays]